MKYQGIVLIAIIALVALSSVEAQRKKKKGRKDACHLKGIEHCIEKVQELGKRKEPSVLIATNEGLNTICKTTREDLPKCIKSFTKKCGTPLHRELADLVVDQITNQVGRFCDEKNPNRKEFLKHSPCIHKKVLSGSEYKTTCNNNFLATVDKVDDEPGQQDSDNTHSTICCGYNRWDGCTRKMISKECGKEAVDSFADFVGESFGTMAKMVCPGNLYTVKSDVCKQLLPPIGTIVKKNQSGDNALTKYVTSLFSFLFVLN